MSLTTSEHQPADPQPGPRGRAAFVITSRISEDLYINRGLDGVLTRVDVDEEVDRHGTGPGAAPGPARGD